MLYYYYIFNFHTGIKQRVEYLFAVSFYRERWYYIPLYAFLPGNFSPFASEIRIFGSNFDNRMRFKAHVLKLESVPTTYSGQSYSKVVSLAHRNLLHCHVENNEPFRRRIERMSYRNFILSWIRFLFTDEADNFGLRIRLASPRDSSCSKEGRIWNALLERKPYTQRVYNRVYTYTVYVTVRGRDRTTCTCLRECTCGQMLCSKSSFPKAVHVATSR